MAIKTNQARAGYVGRGSGHYHHQRAEGGRGDPGRGPGSAGLQPRGLSLDPRQRDGGAGGEGRARRRGAVRGRGPAPGGGPGHRAGGGLSLRARRKYGVSEKGRQRGNPGKPGVRDRGAER